MCSCEKKWKTGRTEIVSNNHQKLYHRKLGTFTVAVIPGTHVWKTCTVYVMLKYLMRNYLL